MTSRPDCLVSPTNKASSAAKSCGSTQSPCHPECQDLTGVLNPPTDGDCVVFAAGVFSPHPVSVSKDSGVYFVTESLHVHVYVYLTVSL